MRWDNLFDDLESQLELELSAEEVDLRAEEERLRLSRLGLRDRLYALHIVAAGAEARTLRLILQGGKRVAVIPTTFGRDWFAGELIDESDRRPSCIVPIDAIDGMLLARRQVEPSIDVNRPEESASALSGRLVCRSYCATCAGGDIPSNCGWMTAQRKARSSELSIEWVAIIWISRCTSPGSPGGNRQSRSIAW